MAIIYYGKLWLIISFVQLASLLVIMKPVSSTFAIPFPWKHVNHSLNRHKAITYRKKLVWRKFVHGLEQGCSCNRKIMFNKTINGHSLIASRNFFSTPPNPFIKFRYIPLHCYYMFTWKYENLYKSRKYFFNKNEYMKTPQINNFKLNIFIYLLLATGIKFWFYEKDVSCIWQ